MYEILRKLWSGPLCALILTALPLQALGQSTHVQIVHAAPDFALATMDVYVNGDLVADDIGYAEATAGVEVPVGLTAIALAPSGSSSVAEAYVEQNVMLVERFEYWVVAAGVSTPEIFPSNPDNLPTDLSISVGAKPEGAIPADQFRIRMFNALLDAPSFDFWVDGDPDYVLRSGIGFGSFSGIDGGIAGEGDGFLTEAGREWPREIDLTPVDFSGILGEAVLEVPIGFFGEAPPERGLRWLWVHPDGTTEFQSIAGRAAKVQFISASADPGLGVFDLYVDGFLVKDDMEYRGCTPLLRMSGEIPMMLAIAPSTSTSADEAFYTQEVVFEEGKSHQAVVAGVLHPGNYPPNPSGADISLRAYVDAEVRASVSDGRLGIRMFHARIDLGPVDLWDEYIGGYKAFNDVVFGEFTEYEYPTSQRRTGILTHAGAYTEIAENSTDFTSLSGKTVLDVLLENPQDLMDFSGAYYLLDGTEYWGNLMTAIDDELGVPSNFRLSPNYPNPFNPTTVIEFDVPSASPIRLEVFNLLGQRVSLLIDGVLAPGTHRISWQAAGDVPSGSYLYRIVAPEWTASRLMTLLK